MQNKITYISKNLSSYLCVLLICFLSSCLEIKEDIYINKQGSGKYKIGFDFSSIANELNAITARYQNINDSLVRAGYPKDSLYISPILKIDSIFQKQKKKISQLEGISNIKIDIDTLIHTYEISFEYASIKQLNKAIGPKETNGFTWKKGELHRPLGFWLNTVLKSVLHNEKNAHQTKFLLRFYNRMNFTTRTHVPAKIKKYNNDRYSLSNDKTILSYSLRLSEILDDIVDYSLTVKYK